MLLKAGIALAISVEVLFFTILPYFYTGITTNKKINQIFDNFSAGLFMGIAFLHIIPEAN